MRKDILKLIGEIQILAVQISTRTKHDVIVRYYGHVHSIDVEIIRNGYNRSWAGEKICDMYMDSSTNTEIKTELKMVKRKLEELKEEI